MLGKKNRKDKRYEVIGSIKITNKFKHGKSGYNIVGCGEE